MSILSRKIGIDLGTSNVRVHVSGEGVVVNEPTAVALYGDRSIADVSANGAMLQHLVARVQGRPWLFKPEIMVCVPSAAGSMQRRAVTAAAIATYARQAWLIDEPLAAAIGAGLPIADRHGTAVCAVGAATTEVAVIAQSGVVAVQSIAVAGNRIDEAIASYVRDRHGVAIDQRTAERAKIECGSAVRMEQPLVTTLPNDLQITSNDIADAIEEPLRRIAGAIRAVLDETPPRLAAEVVGRGLVLTGGGAQLRGLDKFLSLHAGIPVSVAREPQTSAVRGAGAALHDFELLKRNHSYL